MAQGYGQATHPAHRADRHAALARIRALLVVLARGEAYLQHERGQRL